MTSQARSASLVHRELYSEKRVVLEERRLRVDNSPLGPFSEAFALASLSNNYRWARGSLHSVAGPFECTHVFPASGSPACPTATGAQGVVADVFAGRRWAPVRCSAGRGGVYTGMLHSHVVKPCSAVPCCNLLATWL